jgi:5-methylcytosine-specific restriction endonuclease McrA
MIPQGIITAAIERLQSGRLSKAERRAALILGGGSVHAPKKALVLPGKTKTERKAERFDRLAAIRTGVFARAERERGLRCEWYCERVASELHHVEQGGARRSLEAVENCAAICTECHRAYHRGELDTLRSAATWAVEHGFREAARTIARRTAKIEDTQAGLVTGARARTR